ncbi:cysteine proteinase [Lentinula detonsa]|uniref:ubiquitinyl hydrolase 1 n=1 Tax=Lentinula detonsa TaxID=2804962 RepID=A0A9W8P6T8_9AGAR|nr:cysteine proteinase [Lentinula detonsa]
MAKSKNPTPQEIYRAKKQQEEQERLSLLPPGLVNHGNTCFMNSVLQGLIATRLLSQLVHFEPIPPQVQEHSNTLLASQRSPQLTNGHELGGIYEQNWDNSMPIGDVFISIMYRAWEAQRLRKRESMSPRPLLTTLGRKYDQYMDFAQQDAHEFLRILLDAMRMEELDVIKKRQPPASPANKAQPRRRSTITPANLHSVSSKSNEDHEDQSTRLTSLSDMLFGGQLTSILVCQKCKNVSQTYEDFNDLSLSIKAEDYAREKKRDKLKKFARKMYDASGIRSSSVPPAQNTNGIVHHEPIFSPDESRRRSLDGLTNGNSDNTITDDEDAVIVDVYTDNESTEKPLPRPPGPGPHTSDEKHLEFAVAPKLVRSDKSKDKDGWARIGRRISMSVGIGKKGKEKERSSRSMTRRSADLSTERSRSPIVESVQQPEIRLSRPSLSPERPQSTPPIFLKRAITSQDQVTSKKLKPRPQSLTPNHSASAIPTANSSSSKSHPPHHHWPKSPKLPKSSKAEAEYLRAILADIHTAHVSGTNAFDFLTNWTHSSPGDDPQATGSSSSALATTWLAKLGQLPLAGIEECLRMFTAVEVLDGENMVGCRRCWKLANGWYEDRTKKREEKRGRERIREESEEDEDDTDDSEDEDDEDYDDEPESEIENVNAFSVISSPPDVSGSSMPEASSNAAFQNLPDATKQEAPAFGTSARSATGFSESHRPIPLICTTHAEAEGRHSPSLATAKPEGKSFSLQSKLPAPQLDASEGFEELLLSDSSNSKTHLKADVKTLSTADYESDGEESDVTSISTATSALASGQSLDSLADTSITGPSINPSAASSEANGRQSSSQTRPSPTRKKHRKKSQGAKPVIMRPAYKRYLIATPPPVLVIHLKRFQQTSKNPIMSFSSGLKKLEDYVAFPEYFDLTPFLAPKKEDFGLGKQGKKFNDGVERRSKDDKERCMYRLYAVVVHIGNMLGGHYISYTALPNQSDIPTAATQADSTTDLPPPPSGRSRQWAYISDTVVRLTTLQEVLKAKAYICMYERV